MLRNILLKEMDSNIVRDYILYVHFPHKRRSIGDTFRFYGILGLVFGVLLLVALHFSYIFTPLIAQVGVSTEVIVAFIIFNLAIFLTIVFIVLRCKSVVQKWEIDESVTEADRARHDEMKVTRQRISGSIVGGLVLFHQAKIQRSPDSMLGEPIDMLILFALMLWLIYVITQCLYRYFLVKVHCPDLNEKTKVDRSVFIEIDEENDGEDVNFFAGMDKRNHLDRDEQEDAD